MQTIITSNNPLILTGMHSFFSTEDTIYTPLENVSDTWLTQENKLVVILTGNISGTILAEILLLCRRVKRDQTPVIFFSQYPLSCLNKLIDIIGGKSVYGRLTVKEFIAVITAFKISHKKTNPKTIPRLNLIECLILAQALRGKSAHLIAKTMGISIKTTYTHRQNIIHKLGFQRLTEILIS